MTVEKKPLSFIKSFHEVRPISQDYVEKIRAKIREIGVKPYPLSVTDDGVLYGGRHRYEAFNAEGITECLMHIFTPDNLDKEAIDLNRASEDALPMTFVDYAELVWKRIEEGQTQQAIAERLGWSRGQVAKYAMLSDICSEAWAVIVPTVRDYGTRYQNDDGTQIVPTGTFTEGLLRSILSLRPEQQIKLVKKLAKGKCDKGRSFGKSEFKEEAEKYRLGNTLEKKAFEMLEEKMTGDKLEEYKEKVAEKIRMTVYISEAINGELGPLALKMVQSFIDEYEKAQNFKVLVKSLADITREEIADESIDAIITDPPYPKEYVGLFNDLGELAARVLKPGGSLICLVGQSYLPEYLEILSRHLDYHWTISVHTPGGQAVQLWAKEIISYWKPAIWFTKGKRECKWDSDFFQTKTNENDKEHHHWGQSERLMMGLVDRGSLIGETILDPFLGGGTTGVVCKKSGRKFIGVEIDETVAANAIKRISEVKD